MIAAEIWTNPAFVGIVVAIPSAALGYLGYRRARHIDKIAEQAGIATSETTSIGQVIEGLNAIIANLQKDNEVLRTELSRCQRVIDDRIARLDSHNREIRNLREREKKSR